MTPETLRTMLHTQLNMYKFRFIIFDRIQYIGDERKGHLLEEAILLMPQNIRFVFLSSNISNARQFSQWITSLNDQSCHLVETVKRPVPLQHFIFPIGGDGLFEIVKHEEFKETKFKEAMQQLTADDDKGSQNTSNSSDVVKIIRTLKERELFPCAVFSFSRKESEDHAMALNNMDFNSEEEKKLVSEVCDIAFSALSPEDKKLPHLKNILPLLRRGIGVRHCGLLPIIQELVEIFFEYELIKLIFVTENFSSGLKLSARSVLFTSVRKFDGEKYRWLSSNEYAQMSGCAGRRAEDENGLVISMLTCKMSADDVKNIMMVNQEPLNSNFRVSYKMILNLMNDRRATPEYIIKNCFGQFQNQQGIPELRNRVETLEKQFTEFVLPFEGDLKSLVRVRNQIADLKKSIKHLVNDPKNLVPWLQVGRLFKVVAGSRDFGWGALVNYQRRQNIKLAHK